LAGCEAVVPARNDSHAAGTISDNTSHDGPLPVASLTGSDMRLSL
jgi:hypothetical protein